MFDNVNYFLTSLIAGLTGAYLSPMQYLNKLDS
jgi:hypothetical protein